VTAYTMLGVVYSNIGENSRGAEQLRKAYELRDRVSEREKFYVESAYYFYAVGDLEKARQVDELWAQTYPRDDIALTYLGLLYGRLGQNDTALTEMREALRLNPASGLRYSNLANSYLRLNRPEEARAVAEEAHAKNLDSETLRETLYQLAFLQNDAAGMAQQFAWSTGKPGVEDVFLSNEANTTIYFGRLGRARELMIRAVESALRSDEKETAAGYEAALAWTEADFGNSERARQRAATALSRVSNHDVQFMAAMALARAGDSMRAARIADELAKQFPQDTLTNYVEVPTVHGAIEINRYKPSTAIDSLQAASTYELGWVDSLCSAFLRGQAYLLLRQGGLAALEFQKILDHRSIVQNGRHGALAHLGLARAYALQGETAKARAKYQDFLTLWKDADPDIPILKQAKAEYARLQ